MTDELEVKVDPETGALYATLSQGTVARTVPADEPLDSAMIDVDAAGRVLGVELLSGTNWPGVLVKLTMAGALVLRGHPPVDVYLVITGDRHDSTEVIPFAGADEAIAYAGQEVAANARHPELIEPEDRELNDAMREDGWVWYCRYDVEGDSVRVIKRELR